MKKRTFLAAAVAASLLALPACGGSAGSDGPTTLTVWLMDGSVNQELLDDVNEEFHQAHPGVTVKAEIQTWNGVMDRLTTALAGNNPPDVVELGNTQTAQFAQSGALVDLTDRVEELDGGDWLPGLAESGRWEGRQYGVPFYAGSRVVAYRRDLFREAGVAVPRTREEWLAVTRTLNERNRADRDFQGIYLPGQSWYVYAGFLWDEGGDLAVRDGDGWRGGLDTPQAAAAISFYRQLQSLSRARKDADEATPQQYEVFAKGSVAQMVALPWEINSAVAAAPELAGKVGVFPVPGREAGRPGTVFTGGSNLALAAGGDQQELAHEYLALLTGEKYQTRLARENGAVPNRASLAGVITDETTRVVAAAAAHGRVTPVDPRWAAVEAGANPVKDYMTAVLGGADPTAAGVEFSRKITERMNSRL